MCMHACMGAICLEPGRFRRRFFAFPCGLGSRQGCHGSHAGWLRHKCSEIEAIVFFQKTNNFICCPVNGYADENNPVLYG